jgi:hypothetical protein
MLPASSQSAINALARDKAVSAWAKKITLDTVVLTAASNDIVSINGLHKDKLTMKHLRRFCVIHRISGYKNKKRDETIQLIVLRMRSQAIEKLLYPDDGDPPADKNDDHPYNDADSDVVDTAVVPQYQHDTSSDEEDHLSTSSSVVPQVTAVLQPEASSPTTRAMARAAQMQQEAVKKTKKKKSKSTPPSSITQEGSYYRAINVYFDEMHRVDVSRLGEPPSMGTLDARQFRNKDVFDKLLKSYLAMSIASDHIHLIAFADNPYLQAMGVVSGDVPFASEFDVLTSEELKDVMEYINHWYQHAHRNSKKSGNHGNFEDFVGDKPYIYYYHLWLQEIPHLFALAVPTLPVNVVRESCAPSSIVDEPVSSGSSNPAARRQRKNSQNATVPPESTATSAAMQEIGRAAGEKVVFMKALATEKAQRSAIQKEKDLLDLFEMYDKSLKRKSEELSVYNESDTTEGAESLRAVIGMLKTKRERVLKSLNAL